MKSFTVSDIQRIIEDSKDGCKVSVICFDYPIQYLLRSPEERDRHIERLLCKDINNLREVHE